MSITIVSLLVVLLLFLFFAIGLEIGFSMALAGIIGYAAIVNVQAALNLAAIDMFSTFSSYGFLVIPLFVLMGQIGGNAGISRNLYYAGYKFLGHIPGGLAIGTVVAATAFKAICGSSVATAATFSTIAIPEMDRYGYDRRLSTGTVATVGTLGVIIPPSVVLIIYGLITETSIGKLFLAGIIPGLMVAFSFGVTLYGWCKINPKLGPRGEKSTWRDRVASLPPVLLVIAIFILVVGGLMKGVFSPSEAGSVGSFAVLLLVVAKRDMNLKGFLRSVTDSLRIACMLFMLLVGTVILGHFFAVTRTPFVIADLLSNLPIHRNIIMIIIVFTFLIGGSFVEDLAFLVLAVPFFLPLVLKLGFDPIYFGVIVSVTSMIGIIIPPMAINVFVVSGITKVPFGTIYKGCYPFIVGMGVCLFILLFFPQISLWLPNLLIK
jgi:C4-dicarboxylate transporter DctM subunit